ncbi:hypothetical protein [Enterococcus sp. AZ194]
MNNTDKSAIYPNPSLAFLLFKRVLDIIGASIGMIFFLLVAVIL